MAGLFDKDRGGGEIRVGIAEQEDRYIIEISDNGKGFPAEHRERLLEPYMTMREGGTGLGLAIVSRIMEEHGGGIELADNPAGRGGRVRLWIAKALPQVEELTAAREPATAGQGARS
jgi:two-component system nitrogen regulation sensor histidine kinase NtrY